MKKIFLSIVTIVTLNVNANDKITLSESYELALSQDSKTKSAYYETEASKENVEQAKSRLYPQVSGSVGYTTRDYTLREMDYNDVRSTGYNMVLTQPVYDHSIYTRLSLEKLKVKSAEIDYGIKKQELLQKIGEVYISLVKSQTLVNLYESYKNLYDLKSKEIDSKYGMYMASKMDMLQARVQADRANIELNKEKNNLSVNLLKFKNLTAVELESVPAIDLENLDISYFKDIQKEIFVENALDRNLEINKGEIMVEYSKRDIENSRTGHYPKLELSARYTKSDASDDANTDYEKDQRVMMQLSVPIYQGGYVSSKIKQSKILENASMEQLRSAQEDAKIKYDQALHVFNLSLSSIEIYKESLYSAKLYVEAISQGLAHGLKSEIDLNDALSKLNEIKKVYIEAVGEFMLSYVVLLNLTNSSTQDNIEQIDKFIN